MHSQWIDLAEGRAKIMLAPISRASALTPNSWLSDSQLQDENCPSTNCWDRAEIRTILAQSKIQKRESIYSSYDTQSYFQYNPKMISSRFSLSSLRPLVRGIQVRTFFDSSPKTKAKVVLVGSGRMGNVSLERGSTCKGSTRLPDIPVHAI